MRIFRSYSCFAVFDYLSGQSCTVGHLPWDHFIHAGGSAAYLEMLDEPGV
jgi:hypothetical protein